jgi:hypothetical protein
MKNLNIAIKLLEQIIEKNKFDDSENKQVGESWNTFHLKILLSLLKDI